MLICDDCGEAKQNPSLFIGITGTVVELYQDGYNNLIGVEWDKRITAGHNCGGNGKNGHGWRVEPEYLDQINSGPIDETQFMEVLYGV